jgi:hypothetical protein
MAASHVSLWATVYLPAVCELPQPLTTKSLTLHVAAWLQVMYLRGLRYVYQFNIFLYMMMGIMGISIIINVIKGPGKWKRAKREDAYKF